MDWPALTIFLTAVMVLIVLGSVRWIRRNWFVVGLLASVILPLFAFMALVPLRSIPFDPPAHIAVYTGMGIGAAFGSSLLFLIIVACWPVKRRHRRVKR